MLPLVFSHLNVWGKVSEGMSSVGLGSVDFRGLRMAIRLIGSSPRSSGWSKDKIQRTTGLGTSVNTCSTWERPTHQSEVDIYTKGDPHESLESCCLHLLQKAHHPPSEVSEQRDIHRMQDVSSARKTGKVPPHLSQNSSPCNLFNKNARVITFNLQSAQPIRNARVRDCGSGQIMTSPT